MQIIIVVVLLVFASLSCLHFKPYTLQEDVNPEPPSKRPALAADASTAKRNRRMFGALLMGTLQKFQVEDQQFRSSKVAVARQEIEQRAQDKAEAEAVRLREEARLVSMKGKQ